jgi:hypothetical protein
LIIGFIDHLQTVITSNYKALVTLCSSLQQCYVFSVCRVFTSRCLLTAFNGGRSLYSGFPNYPHASATSSQRLNCSPLTYQLFTSLHCTVLTLTNCSAYNISARNAQKNTVPLLLFNCCLLGICCLAAGIVYRVIT